MSLVHGKEAHPQGVGRPAEGGPGKHGPCAQGRRHVPLGGKASRPGRLGLRRRRVHGRHPAADRLPIHAPQGHISDAHIPYEHRRHWRHLHRHPEDKLVSCAFAPQGPAIPVFALDRPESEGPTGPKHREPIHALAQETRRDRPRMDASIRHAQGLRSATLPSAEESPSSACASRCACASGGCARGRIVVPRY